MAVDVERVVRRELRRYTLAEWLTTERAIYAAILVMAALVRLYGLDLQPLGPEEAAQALPAWQASRGLDYTLTGSPLLFSLQRLIFTPFGGDDAMARWWPALANSLAVLLFFGLRDRLGRGGALLSAAVWALSPLSVFTARLGLGYGLVPPLALALLVCLNLYAAAPARRWLLGAAIALAALLAAAPAAYTVILAALAALFVWHSAWPSLLSDLQAHRRALAVAFLLALVIGATGVLTAPVGLAAAFGLLGAWLQSFAPQAGGYTAGGIAGRLVLSETFALVFGLGGAVMAWRLRDRFSLWVGLSTVLALIVALAGGGRHPADLGLVALGLALLAGPAIAWTLRGAALLREDTDFWLLAGLALALLIGAAISLPSYFSAPDDQTRTLYLGVGLGTGLLFVILWLIYGFAGSWPVVGYALPLVGLVVLGAWNIGQLTGINFDADPLRRPAVLAQTPGPGWIDLPGDLRDLSALNGGGANGAAVDLVLPPDARDPLAPMLRWALRDFSALRVATSVPSAPAPLVISPADNTLPLGESYSGADYMLLEEWSPAGLEGLKARLRWLLYREAQTPAVSHDVVLWRASAGPDAGRAVGAVR